MIDICSCSCGGMRMSTQYFGFQVVTPSIVT
jgi:hypothetical protein